MTCRGLSKHRPYIPEPGDYLTGRVRELFLAIRDEMKAYMIEFWPSDQMYIDVYACLLHEQEQHSEAIVSGNDSDGYHANARQERAEVVEMYRIGCGLSNEALARITKR